MKLLTVSASPYGRKVRVVISELAIIEKIEIINDNPWLKETLVSKANPIGKVPVLILDDNNSLYDSKLICEYLDNQSKKILLYPEAGKERWDVLRLQNLADQMMDAFILRRLESKRPGGKQHEPWINRQWNVIQRSLNLFKFLRMILGGYQVFIKFYFIDFQLQNLFYLQGIVNHGLTPCFLILKVIL